MNRQQISEQIQAKKSFLCTGLDTEISKLPQGVEPNVDGMLAFNKQIIQATHQQSVAYKINTAFYEQYGTQGWQCMEQTLQAIPQQCFTIADAKRGDIGNTSSMYARAFFETLNFDAITVAPYMGEDSLRPFLEFKDKWVICLALTSNPGHADFQKNKLQNGQYLYENVIETVCKYGNPDNLMFVVGATRGQDIAQIRTIIPHHYLLVPGVGAQGGDLDTVITQGKTPDGGLLINSSRGIIYASNQSNFAPAAQQAAIQLQQQMQVHF